MCFGRLQQFEINLAFEWLQSVNGKLFYFQAFLQEDPALFCNYLASEEGLKEYSSSDIILNASLSGSSSEFTDFVSAMKILTQVKLKQEGTTQLSKLLSDNQHRELISAKILSQKWTKNIFDPMGNNSDIQNLILDLLVWTYRPGSSFMYTPK